MIIRCIVMYIYLALYLPLLFSLLAFHRIILGTFAGLGDLKSSKGAIPLVFVVPERLPVVWYSHLPVLAVSS